MGITKNARPIATVYSVQFIGVKPKAFAKIGISHTAVVAKSEPMVE